VVTSLEGTGYRLPTEAEWEFVCRAGTDSAFCFGESVAQSGDAGWFSENSNGTTHPVRSKEANPWGVYDTSGNVWEWCEDCFGNYPGGPVTDPRSPLSVQRVLRGGSWKDPAAHCRSAWRCNLWPDSPFSNCGFRVVLTSDAVNDLLSRRAVTAPSAAVAPFDEKQARAHQQAWADHLGLPVEYTNSIGMKFRLVPLGEFLMGSTPEEIEAALKVADSRWQEHIQSEGPQHKVILTKPIDVGRTEVAQA
jgi:formylglycine-generating enzyme required for sulfatase activity